MTEQATPDRPMSDKWPDAAYQVAADAIFAKVGDEVGCCFTCAQLALDAVLPFLKREIDFAYYVGGEAEKMRQEDGRR